MTIGDFLHTHFDAVALLVLVALFVWWWRE